MWPLTLAIGAVATHRFILLEVVFSEGDMIRPQCVVSVFTPARRRFASVSPSSNVLRWVFGCCVLKSRISKYLACSFPLSAVALPLSDVVQSRQTVCLFGSFRETTTGSIVAVESRCREGRPLPAICQRKHFSRCSISHICYQLQMFFGCMKTSHPQHSPRSTGHPPFSIQMCCRISETQSGKELQLIMSLLLPVMD